MKTQPSRNVKTPPGFSSEDTDDTDDYDYLPLSDVNTPVSSHLVSDKDLTSCSFMLMNHAQHGSKISINENIHSGESCEQLLLRLQQIMEKNGSGTKKSIVIIVKFIM
jgi:hypothetical protein